MQSLLVFFLIIATAYAGHHSGLYGQDYGHQHYGIQKVPVHIPVPVIKHVVQHVPVYKPYPVHIPIVKHIPYPVVKHVHVPYFSKHFSFSFGKHFPIFPFHHHGHGHHGHGFGRY